MDKIEVIKNAIAKNSERNYTEDRERYLIMADYFSENKNRIKPNREGISRIITDLFEFFPESKVGRANNIYARGLLKEFSEYLWGDIN